MVLLLAVSAILGISAFHFYQTLLVIILFIAGCFYYSSAKKTIVYVVMTMSFFYLIASIHAHFQQSSLIGTEKQLIITFNEVPDFNGSSFRTFAVTLNGEKILLSYQMQTEEEKQRLKEHFQIGLVCQLKGELQRPSVNRNENDFNYRQYLLYQGVHWQFKSQSNLLQSCQITDPSIVQKVKMIRWQGLQHIEEHFPEEARGFAAALLFGDSDWIEEEIFNAYKSLSLVHILAISGLHVGIITAGLYYLFIRLGCPIERTKVILIALLPFYCIVAGGAPSVLRACLTVMVFLSFTLCKIRIPSIAILSYIFLFLLMVNPYYLFHVGFQLSFFITFALLMSNRIVERTKYRGMIWQSFIVTAICQLCSLPIILYYFHEFSLWGFLLNVIYIPLYTVILLPATFLVFCISLLSLPGASWFISILESLFYLANTFAVMMAKLPYVSLSFGKPSFLFVFFLTMLIIFFFYFWEKRNKRHMYICSSVLFLLLLLFYHKVSLSPYGEVTFIDVGQGDSVLIKQPFGKEVYLIDTGGVLSFEQESWEKRRKTYDPGQDIVVPLLKSKGIRKIDKLILTHDDQDHIGGAVAVLQAVQVDEILVPEALKEGFSETAVVDYARKREIPIVYGKMGQGWRSGEDTFRIIHPAKYEEDSNESSLVLLAEMNHVKWLFTGDVGEVGEKEIVKRFPQLTVDVLKVGHHGSKSSSSESFLDATDARVAIISAGVNNRYGHPHPEVLEALEAKSMPILRTDLHGGISYKYFLGKGTFSTVIP